MVEQNENSDFRALFKRVEQLEKQIAELNHRTRGMIEIGPGYPAPMPECRLPDGWPDWKRNYKLTENS